MEPELFLLNVTGQIEKGDFPELDDLYCKYSFSYGKDWIVTSVNKLFINSIFKTFNAYMGLEDGISQMSTRKVVDDSFVFTWNLPVDVSFKSTNIFGWPQLSICVYGLDFFGNDVIRGYGATHLPLQPGSHRKTFPVVVPSSSSVLQRISSWITGRRPEFTDPKMITQGEGRDVVRVSSQGFITAQFNVITKHVDMMGYRVQAKT